jgi:hypothetical protein
MEVKITIEDLRTLKVGQKYCVRGCRLLCYQHGISFHKLTHEGIPVVEVEHIQDDMLIRIIEIANKRVRNGG